MSLNRISKKDYTWACLVCAFVLAAVVVLHSMLQWNDMPKENGMLTAPGKLAIDYMLGDDTIHGTVAKGEKMLVMGVVKGTAYQEPRLLVQTEKGDRGLVAARTTGLPMVLRKSGDTVTINKVDTKGCRYNMTTRGGLKRDLPYSSLMPALPDSMTHRRLDEDGHYTLSVEKFERLYMGQTLGANDSLLRQATVICHDKKKGTRAYYGHLLLYNNADGHFYHPTVSYDDSLRATGYTLRKGSRRVLPTWVPLASTIIDARPIGWMTQESSYAPGTTTEKNSVKKWLTVLGLMLLSVLWYLMTPVIPVALMGGLVKVHWVYYHLGDKTLRWLFGIVALLSFYVWTVIIVAHTSVWWLVLPISAVILLIWYSRACAPMCQNYHVRCKHCRRMNSYTLDHTEKGEPEFKKERASTHMSNAEALQFIKSRPNAYKKEEYERMIQILTYEAIEGTVVINRNKMVKIETLTDFFRCPCGAEFTKTRTEKSDFPNLYLSPSMEELVIDYKYHSK